MGKIYTGVPGPLGSIVYLDQQGNIVGSSMKSFLGPRVHFDANGRQTGVSHQSFLGTEVYIDSETGIHTSMQSPGAFGSTTYFEIETGNTIEGNKHHSKK